MIRGWGSLTEKFAVVIAKPRQEEKAACNFELQGIEYFLPRLKRRKEIIPLFPRYLFASIDQGFHKLYTTKGVQGLVTFGQYPALVCSKVIGMVKALCDEKGVYKVDTRKFRQGQKVKPKDGLFSGQFGTVARLSDSGRIEVLMNILGRSTRVVMDEDDIIAA